MSCGPVFEAQRAIAIAHANCKGASDFLAHDVSVGPTLLAERPVENIGQTFRAFAKEIARFEQEFVFIVRSVLGDWLRVARLRTLCGTRPRATEETTSLFLGSPANPSPSRPPQPVPSHLGDIAPMLRRYRILLSDCSKRPKPVIGLALEFS